MSSESCAHAPFQTFATANTMQNREGSSTSDSQNAHQLGDSNLSESAYDQVLGLLFRYRKFWRKEDLDEYIKVFRAALALRPEGHPHRLDSLNNLAATLTDRFELSHQREDLDESIRLYRAALALRPEGHPDRYYSLNGLAISLGERFSQSHQREDLDERIRLFRAAVALNPEGHPDRPDSLNNLAASLTDRFNLSHQHEDLDDSVRVHRVALALRPEGHQRRSASLHNLALSLNYRFRLSHQREDLDDSIRLSRAALALYSEGHPNRGRSLNSLAESLRDRFKLSHQQEDLDECIELEYAELNLFREGHPSRSLSLDNLAVSFITRYEQTYQLDDLEESMKLRKSAALDTFSSSLTRLKGVIEWSIDARMHDHKSALEAYEIALSLLQSTLTIGPTLQRQHDLLIGESSYPTLASDAASYATEKGYMEKAVEMLEQGRGMLWSQMRGFRTSLDDLAKADQSLADRLKDVTSQLEALSTAANAQQATSSICSTSDVHVDHSLLDEMLKLKHELSEEQERIVEEIRKRPGFDNFLKATSFATLQSAAEEGPVIIVNPCEYRSDCIIVLKESEPLRIPLAETFYKEAWDQATHLIEARKKLREYPRGYDDALLSVLEWLWKSVVSLVVEKLTELGIPKQSRIWWCPASILTSLPFHAAGPSGVSPVR